MSKKACEEGLPPERTKDAKFKCKDCGRYAAKKKHLCAPKKLKTKK